MRDERTGHGKARFEIRSFGTTAAERKQARAWITGEGCTDGIMESTGTYGKPVFHLREGQVRVALANPQEGKARQGHQTDHQDAWWRALGGVTRWGRRAGFRGARSASGGT